MRNRQVRWGGSERSSTLQARQIAVAHGWFNIVGGLWPLLSMRSFEHVTGPKVDRWLVRSVAGLMVGNGLTQLASARSPEGLASARLLGQTTAATLGAIDVFYASRGRISKVYLVDAAAELGWLLAWLASSQER